MHSSARYILLTLSFVAIFGLTTFKTTQGQTMEAGGDTNATATESTSSSSPAKFKIALKSVNGSLVQAQYGGGGAVNAASPWIREWETFTLVDLNGGQLQSGDRVNLQTFDGHFLCAEGGGGAELNATRLEGREWETFTIWRPDGAGNILHGDVIALQSYNGYYVVAEGGGGGVVNANRTAIGPWERFTFIESNTSYSLTRVSAPAVNTEFGVVTGAIEYDATPFPTPNPQSLRTDADQAMREFRVGLGAKWIRIEADRNGSDVTQQDLASTYRRIVERAHGQGLRVIVVLNRRYCPNDSHEVFSTNFKNRLADIHRIVFNTNESIPDAYEIGNEPNMWETTPCRNEMGWRIPGDLFAKVLANVWAWHNTLPERPRRPKIISGGTHNVYHRTDSNQQGWWNPFFTQLRAQNSGRPFDYFGVHPYNYRDIDRNCLDPSVNSNWLPCFDQSPGWWQTTLRNLLQELPGLIQNATGVSGTQLYVTEFGWQVHPDPCPPNVFCGVFTDQQAGAGMEIYRNTLLPSSLIPVALWYNYRDGGGETFGLRRAWNGTEYPPKPYVWNKFSTIAGGAGDPNVFWPPNPCYPDVPEGSTFHTYIHNLSHQGVVDAYPDDPNGNFLPDTIATRAIYAKWIVRAMNWPTINPPVARFSDVPTDHPYYQYIETAVSHGIASGYDCGGVACFRPSNPLTRAQASKMISLAMGWPLLNPETPRFVDVPTYDAFYTYVETVAGHGVVSGYADGTFRPGNLLTRGQASKIIWNAISAVGVQYQAHVQYIGWQDWRADWQTAGTTGQSWQMEALKIQLANAPYGMGVCYQAHVQNYGWMGEVCNGQQAGTAGQNLRMEALKVRLVNAPSGKRVCYQAHVQNYGWMSEVCDGQQAGTTGQALRIEAVRLRIIQ